MEQLFDCSTLELLIAKTVFIMYVIRFPPRVGLFPCFCGGFQTHQTSSLTPFSWKHGRKIKVLSKKP